MRAEHSLAEEFIGSHPAEAARVLESQPSVRLLDLLNGLPVPLAAECLRRVARSKCVEVLAETSADRAARMFEALQAHEVASVLRLMPPEQRDRLLEETAADLSEPIRRLLRYPEGTAGALMDPRVPAIPGDISVVEARSLLRGSPLHTMYYVYIVDRANRLIGVLNLRQLMLTSSKQPLESLMRRPLSSLPSAADRAAILGHPGWRDLHALPVVDDAGRFLGVLRLETMRGLEAQVPADRPYAGALGAAVAFGELCWVAWSKVLGNTGSLMLAQPVRRRGQKEVDRGENT